MYNTLSRGEGDGSKRASNKALLGATPQEVNKLMGGIARVSNPAKVLANGGKITVKGSSPVTTGAEAVVLKSHKSIVVLRSRAKNSKELKEDHYSIISYSEDNDIGFTMNDKYNEISSPKNIIEQGYRWEANEVIHNRNKIFKLFNLDDISLCNVTYYSRYMAEIKIKRINTDGEQGNRIRNDGIKY